MCGLGKDRSGLGNCSIVFLGAFAGANNIYRMVQKFLKPEDDGRAVRQTPGRQSTTETEISDSISRVEKDVKRINDALPGLVFGIVFTGLLCSLLGYGLSQTKFHILSAYGMG